MTSGKEVTKEAKEKAVHFKYRNINDAFKDLVEGIHTKRIPTRVRDSRNGPVLQIEEPVIITYEKPRERVLFNKGRDCNPFFHLFESLWMLAGRNDVAPLRYFNSNIANYSDDGEVFNGAYGYRWRSAKIDGGENFSGYRIDADVDQLDVLIKHLQAKPESRRAVLQMWNVEDDLLKVDTSRDVACNLSVLFSIRKEETPTNDWDCSYPTNTNTFLDMTVFNRSNDMIWGALGANVVHLSFLQEYMACSLGVEVGVYNQVTNNLHCYLDKWKPEEWIENMSMLDEKPLGYTSGSDSFKLGPKLFDDPTQRTEFDSDITEFVSLFSTGEVDPRVIEEFWEKSEGKPFLNKTVCPMILAFCLRKFHGKSSYYNSLEALRWACEDWGINGRDWMDRRKGNAS